MWLGYVQILQKWVYTSICIPRNYDMVGFDRIWKGLEC